MAKKGNKKAAGKPDIQTRELKFGELISTGFEIYRRNFKLIFFIICIVYIPINIILNLLPVNEEDMFGSLFWYSNMAQVLELVLGIIATMAIVYAVNKTVNNEKPELWDSLKSSILAWDKAILTSLLASVILILLYICFIIPGIIYSIYYSFFLYAVILKDIKYKKALDFSKSLVKGRWWRVFGILLATGLLITIAAGLISSILGMFDTFLTNVISETVFDIVFALREVIVAVFFINLMNVKKV
jgi:hypothetical protein